MEKKKEDAGIQIIEEAMPVKGLTEQLILFLISCSIYIPVVGGLLGMAGLKQYFYYLFPGVAVILASCIIQYFPKLRHWCNLCFFAGAVGLLLWYQNTIYSGGKIFLNHLFEQSERAGAYEYDFFIVDQEGVQGERTLLFFLIFSAIVLAFSISCVTARNFIAGPVLFYFFMTGCEIYFGVFPSFDISMLMCGSMMTGFIFSEKSEWRELFSARWMILLCFLLFYTALFFAVARNTDGKNPVFLNYSEKWRDAWGDRVENLPYPGQKDAQEGQGGEDRESTAAAGSEDNNEDYHRGKEKAGGRSRELLEVISRRVASVLPEPFDWIRFMAVTGFLCFIFFVLYRLFRRSFVVHRRSRVFSQSDYQKACCHMFRYLMSWLFCCGLEKKNKSYSCYSEPVCAMLNDEKKEYSVALELWHRASYSDKEIRKEELDWLFCYVNRVKKQLLEKAGPAKKWKLYMKYYL